MRARIIFIILLVLILLFALWPRANRAWKRGMVGRGHGCEVEFTRAIPCVINGKD